MPITLGSGKESIGGITSPRQNLPSNEWHPWDLRWVIMFESRIEEDKEYSEYVWRLWKKGFNIMKGTT